MVNWNIKGGAIFIIIIGISIISIGLAFSAADKQPYYGSLIFGLPAVFFGLQWYYRFKHASNLPHSELEILIEKYRKRKNVYIVLSLVGVALMFVDSESIKYLGMFTIILSLFMLFLYYAFTKKMQKFTFVDGIPIVTNPNTKNKCLSCKSDNKKEYKHCSKCGEPLKKICGGCNKSISFVNKFCPECGVSAL